MKPKKRKLKIVGGVAKVTIAIPASQVDFVSRRVNGARYNGNLSSYYRSLVCDDRDAKRKAA